MRYAVLVLGILGALVAGFLGFRWLKEVHDPLTQQSLALARALLKDVGQNKYIPPSKIQEGKELIAISEYRSKACYFMLAVLPLGLAGAVLGFLRKGIIAGILLLIAFLGPVVIAIGGSSTLIVGAVVFTSPLIVGGILAFFVKPEKVSSWKNEPGSSREKQPIRR